MRPALLELTDHIPDPTLEAQVREVASRVPGVLGLDKCLVRKMGFNYYVDLHVVVEGRIPAREGHRIAHRVESEVLSNLPQISEVLVHIEPEEELALKAAHRGQKEPSPRQGEEFGGTDGASLCNC